MSIVVKLFIALPVHGDTQYNLTRKYDISSCSPVHWSCTEVSPRDICLTFATGYGVGVDEIDVVEAEAIIVEAVALGLIVGMPTIIPQYAVNTQSSYDTLS